MEREIASTLASRNNSPSPSWLLARRPGLMSLSNSYGQLGESGELGDGGGWYAKSGGNDINIDKDKKHRPCVVFCKSVCFLLLLVGLVMVVVTVSIFLTRGKRRMINV